MNQLTATIIITGLTLLAASAVWSNVGESSKKEHNHAALEAGQDQGHKSSAIEAISKNCVTTSHQDCQAIAAIADQLYQAIRSGDLDTVRTLLAVDVLIFESGNAETSLEEVE